VIVTLRDGSDADRVRRALVERGLWVQPLRSEQSVAFYVDPASTAVSADELRRIEGVDDVAVPELPWPRLREQPSVADLGDGVRLGLDVAPQLVAGPCSVESATQLEEIAAALGEAGVRVLRGGAYKPRTSPYAFQGHGERALRWLRDAADAHGMKVVTEVLAPEDAERVAEVADVLQVGSRSMHHAPLLRAVGAQGRPVLLKRGMAATVEEWLQAAEYLRLAGAPVVLPCERGVRSFDPSTRNLLDLGAVALLRHVHRLPVLADPSHATGRRDLVLPLARAALAAGACGVMVEVHPRPGEALSDGPQALSLEAARRLAAMVAASGEAEASP